MYFNIVFFSTSQCSTSSVPFRWTHQNPAHISPLHIRGSQTILNADLCLYGLRPYRKMLPKQLHCSNLWRPRQVEVFSYPMLTVLRKSQAFWKFPRLRPFVFLVRAAVDEDGCGGVAEWNWQGKKPCSSAILCSTYLTWTDLGSNPGPRGDRLATNDLGHFTPDIKTHFDLNYV